MSKEHSQRRTEILEALVQLYLRLNGYFCIPNYLCHRTEHFGLEAEFDVLGMRLQHQHEILPDERKQQNDQALLAPPPHNKIDCIIAEVKEPSVEFNKPIRGREGARLIMSALRMFGVLVPEEFQKSGEGYKLATDLQRQVKQPAWVKIPISTSDKNEMSVRMIVFAPEDAKHSRERQFFKLEHILQFVSKRMQLGVPCSPYRNDIYAPWRGCTGLIVQALDKFHSSGELLTIETLIDKVLSDWEGASK